MPGWHRHSLDADAAFRLPLQRLSGRPILPSVPLPARPSASGALSMNLRLAFVVGLSALPLSAADLDWPQFRGPKRDGLSPDTSLLKSWPTDGPRLVWKAEGVGDGFSSVAVVGDKVVTMGDLDDACYVFAVSRKDGRDLWKAKVGKPGGGSGYPGPRCTPTVDGDRVYAIGQHGDFVCVGLSDGKVHWRVNLPKDFKGTSGTWQYSESPLVDGDKVICTPGGREATILALKKVTGKEAWKGARQTVSRPAIHRS